MTVPLQGAGVAHGQHQRGGLEHQHPQRQVLQPGGCHVGDRREGVSLQGEGTVLKHSKEGPMGQMAATLLLLWSGTGVSFGGCEETFAHTDTVARQPSWPPPAG